MQKTGKTMDTPGTRATSMTATALTRLAYNELAYSVVPYRIRGLSQPSLRNQMLYRLVTILDRRGETVEGKFEMAMDQNGEMFFTSF